ncbi:MAG TPA: hypothetical protein VJ643_08070 [Nitrososphaera sp.]|nr:hypothetical protein [Nitrososphaera sp.]
MSQKPIYGQPRHIITIIPKKKGVAIANLFDVEESVVAPEDGICTF